MMTKFIRLILILFLLPISTAWAQDKAEDKAQGFFEFSAVQSIAVPVNTHLKAHSGDTLVLTDLAMKDVFYRINGKQVFRVDQQEGAVASVNLANLPAALDNVSATLIANTLYVVGNVVGNGTEVTLLTLDLANENANWSSVASMPQGLNADSVLAALHDTLYVTNTQASYAYNPAKDTWKSIAVAPASIAGSIGFSSGDAHLLYVKSQQASSDIWAYHNVTNTWFTIGNLPEAILADAVVSNGTEFTIVAGETLLTGKAVLKATKYGFWDNLVVAVLVILLIGVGIMFSRKEKTSSDYFRAGQTIPWWAASLSIFATGASAISLMAMPAMAYSGNWIYFSIALFLIVIQVPLFVLVYVPLVRRLNITTANEYLERRFGLSVRILGFIGFSLNQILGRMAAILLLPAIAISSIFGVPMEVSILIMGVCTTFFVTMGGLEAVIWTDVLQAIIMIIAVVACCIFAYLSLEVSTAQAWEIMTSQDKLYMFDFSWDWTAPVVIVLFLNSLATSLGYIGDQNFIQRVQCTVDEKAAKKASIAQLFIAVPLNFILFGLGTLLFLYFVTRADVLSPALKADGVFPFFAASTLPVGMAGFVVVALLAATISTVSSAMNSVANLGVEDIYRRFNPQVTDQQCLSVGRYLTLALGVFGTTMALVLANLNDLQSVWNLFLMITGLVIGPITGVFVLGIFTRSANTVGVWSGVIISVAANYYAKTYMDVHATVFISVGVGTCIIVGYLVSRLTAKPANDLTGLTIFTDKTKPELTESIVQAS
ncbi:sodium/solute symporter [Colwelliaceae bacterium BS250]